LAATQGLKVIGCIGILEAAFRRGLVSDLRDVYLALLAQGIRVHPKILNRSLVSFGLSPLDQR
jgi:predicted nucleic acid-binding protein